MLTSLFGELTPTRLPGADGAAVPPPGGTTAANRAGPDATATATVTSPAEDVVVEDSPAAAIRNHFARHRADLQCASAMVTLLDPSQLWASQVVHALAGAAGQPVQRLNLRERATLRTLAVVERTLVPRRGADALRVYHADHRASALGYGGPQEEIGNALAEGSQLTAVIVGALQPQALVALLRTLVQATHQPEWRCPQLVFILPPGAGALRQRILDQAWPARVRASAVTEPLACTASVWNCVLEAWEAAQAWQPPAHCPGDTVDPTTGTPHPGVAAARPGDALANNAWPRRHSPPPQALSRLLAPLAGSDGLLACGIVDLARGDLLASQSRERPPTDLAGLALALCAARQAHQSMAGESAPIDEILITAGPRQTLLRVLPGELALGFVALLDRQHANLALLRFRLLEAERLLA